MPKNIFVLSDILIDYHIDESLFKNGIQVKKGIPVVSGTGFNAAKSFHKHNLNCMLLGYVGNDENGLLIQEKVSELKIPSNLYIHPTKETPVFHIILSKKYSNSIRLSINESIGSINITNDEINKILSNIHVNSGDYIFLTAHFFYRKSLKEAQEMINMIVALGLLIILDLTPHLIYKQITLNDFHYVFGDHIHILISELYTLSNIFDISCDVFIPNQQDLYYLLKKSRTDILVVNYGKENNSSQQVLKIKNEKIEVFSKILETNFTSLSVEEKFGFGDDSVSKVLFEIINDSNKN